MKIPKLTREDANNYLLRCNRCFYIWKPRKSPLEHDKPSKCPQCMSILWDTPVKFPRISEARKKYFASQKKQTRKDKNPSVRSQKTDESKTRTTKKNRNNAGGGNNKKTPN